MKNVYALYAENGNRSGFFIVRDSWTGCYAEVLSVGGKEAGELPGRPPYYGDPKVLVRLYNRDGSIRESRLELSCPGCYSWALYYHQR